MPNSEAPHHPVPLHEAARRLFAGWQAPDQEQDRIRRFMLNFLADHPDGASRSFQAGHLVTSAVVLDPTRTRVLLTRDPAHRLWIELGGHLEPDDATVAAAALREALEESGIPGLRLDPTPVDLEVVPDDCPPGRPSRHLDVRLGRHHRSTRTARARRTPQHPPRHTLHRRTWK